MDSRSVCDVPDLTNHKRLGVTTIAGPSALDIPRYRYVSEYVFESPPELLLVTEEMARSLSIHFHAWCVSFLSKSMYHLRVPSLTAKKCPIRSGLSVLQSYIRRLSLCHYSYRDHQNVAIPQFHATDEGHSTWRGDLFLRPVFFQCCLDNIFVSCSCKCFGTSTVFSNL